MKKWFFIFPLLWNLSLAAICIDHSAQYDHPLYLDDNEIIINEDVEVKAPAIHLMTKGIIHVKGKLSAPCGDIFLHGEEIILDDTAILDSSAAFQGGTLQIGNENSSKVLIKKGAQLFAKCLETGDGGIVCIFSDGLTDFQGTIDASAGPLGGNGGNVEVSSFKELGFSGNVNIQATNGSRGTLRLDPKNAYILSNGSASATGQTFSSDPSSVVFISGEAVANALASGDVSIEANTDLIVDNFIDASSSSNNLTLRSGRSIKILTSISLGGGNLTFSINDSGALTSDRDSGNAILMISDSVTISTLGGNVNGNVGSFGGEQAGEISLSGATIETGGGTINLQGVHCFGGNTTHGICMQNSRIETTDSGQIVLNGTAELGTRGSYGVYLDHTQLLSENGDISLTGTSNSSGYGNIGVNSNESSIRSSGTGNISVTGTGGVGTDMNCGVVVTSNNEDNAALEVDSGTLTVNGTSRGTNKLNHGVALTHALVCSTNTGPIDMTGQSGNGVGSNCGILSEFCSIETSQGSITMHGTGFGNELYNQGLHIEGGDISSEASGGGAAPIHLTGNGGNGTNSNEGVILVGENTTIQSIDGNIVIDGTSVGPAPQNPGVSIQNPNEVFTSGNGTVTIISNP